MAYATVYIVLSSECGEVLSFSQLGRYTVRTEGQPRTSIYESCAYTIVKERHSANPQKKLFIIISRARAQPWQGFLCFILVSREMMHWDYTNIGMGSKVSNSFNHVTCWFHFQLCYSHLQYMFTMYTFLQSSCFIILFF